jgi:hypothetical protein
MIPACVIEGVVVGRDAGGESTGFVVEVGVNFAADGESEGPTSDGPQPATRKPAINIAKIIWPFPVDTSGINLQGLTASGTTWPQPRNRFKEIVPK